MKILCPECGYTFVTKKEEGICPVCKKAKFNIHGGLKWEKLFPGIMQEKNKIKEETS